MGNKYTTAYINKKCDLSNSKIDFWLQPKVVIAGMTKVIESVYTQNPLALGVGIYGIYNISDDEGYLLSAILNSKFISYYFSEKFKEKALTGGYLAINKNTLEEIPFINPKKEVELKFINLSKQIYSLKKQNPKADTSILEKEIDRLVYGVYGLSVGEIEIIET